MLYYSKTNLTLYLENNTPTSNTYVDIYAPFSLTIDPRYIELPKKVRMIEYIWGDGTRDIVNYTPVAHYAYNPQLYIASDVGNPLNYPKIKIFYSNDLNLSIYNVTVNFYCFTLFDIVSSFNITLNLKNPNISSYPQDNSYFSDIHLIKTKMYGSDDKMLYTFQTQDNDYNDYILMTNVDWKLKPISKPSLIESLNLPYKLLKPFETNYSSNTAITGLPIT
jgi:hypothetical protein